MVRLDRPERRLGTRSRSASRSGEDESSRRPRSPERRTPRRGERPRVFLDCYEMHGLRVCVAFACARFPQGSFASPVRSRDRSGRSRADHAAASAGGRGSARERRLRNPRVGTDKHGFALQLQPWRVARRLGLVRRVGVLASAPRHRERHSSTGPRTCKSRRRASGSS
jgi:hypothetical protein